MGFGNLNAQLLVDYNNSSTSTGQGSSSSEASDLYSKGTRSIISFST
jgi:hypothetical protein